MDSPSLNHEYLGIAGDATFVKLAMEFVNCKDSKVLEDNCVAAIQTRGRVASASLVNYCAREDTRRFMSPIQPGESIFPFFRRMQVWKSRSIDRYYVLRCGHSRLGIRKLDR